MSSNAFVAPLRLEIYPSKILLRYLLLIHLLGLGALLLPMQLSDWTRIVLISLVLGNGLFWMRRILKQHLSVTTENWIWRDTDRWRCVKDGSQWTMQTSNYLSHVLVIVRLQNQHGRKRYLLVIRDQVEPEMFLALYRRLKFWRAESEHSTQRETL